MADAELSEPTDEPRTHWVTWALYAGLIGVNAWLVYDAYPKPNPLSELVERVRTKAKGCEGCARRREALKGMRNRMLFDAERAVEGEDIETVPDIIPPS